MASSVRVDLRKQQSGSLIFTLTSLDVKMPAFDVVVSTTTKPSSVSMTSTWSLGPSPLKRTRFLFGGQPLVEQGVQFRLRPFRAPFRQMFDRRGMVVDYAQ